MNIRSNELIKSVGIYNITGQLIRTMNIDSNAATIDMQNINNGLNFVTIQTISNTVTYKVVKK